MPQVTAVDDLFGTHKPNRSGKSGTYLMGLELRLGERVIIRCPGS
jgi:hypothetical protein